MIGSALSGLRATWSRRAPLLLVSIVSGLLVAACYPPIDAGALAWVAWSPWLASLALAPRLSDAAWSGAAHAVALHAPQCLWMVHVMRGHGEIEWPMAAGMYAFGLLTVVPYGIVIAVATSVIARRHASLALLAAPFLSAATDAFKARFAFGHPWLVPGMTLTGPVETAPADLVGVHGLGAIVLLGNAVVASLVLAAMRREPRRRALAVAASSLAVVLASLAYGVVVAPRHADPDAWAVERAYPRGAGEALPPVGEGRILVALVQGAQPQEVKLSSTPEEDRHLAEVQLELTQQALDEGAMLIAWAESAHPATTRRMPWLLPSLSAMLVRNGRGAEVVLGAIIEQPSTAPGTRRELTNSALLVDANGVKGRYDKRRLVPFGEYLPLSPIFGFFPQIVKVAGDLRPGLSDEALPGRVARAGAFVCYEVVLPQRVRAVALTGADVLVNVTNDGWYHGTWMPEQHLRFAGMRAVETRRFVLRAANSGISALIAPDGRVVGRLEEGTRGLLLGSITRGSVVTTYLRWGDAPVVLVGCFALAWAVVESWATRRRAPVGTEAPVATSAETA